MTNMSYNISYTLAGIIIGLVLLLIVIINYSRTNVVSNRFRYFLESALVMYGLDVLTVFTNDHASELPYWFNIALNNLFFFSGAVVALLFLYYVVSFALKSYKPKTRQILYIVNLSVLGVYTITLILNHFFPFYFYFDVDYKYSHGPAYLFVNLLAVLYTIESIVFFIMNRKSLNVKQIIHTTAFFAMFFGSFAVQLFVLPNVLLTDFGTALGSLIVFFSLETPDYVQLMATLKELNDLKASLENQVQERTKELDIQKDSYKQLTIETLSSLARLIDAKDHYTVGHSFRVAAYAKGLSIYLKRSASENEQIYFAGLIHDVGKIGIKDKILTKPGKLTDEEYEIIKSHSAIGGDILKGIDRFPIFTEVARYHHERYDGRGYPDMKSGNDIPVDARIVAICDSFDAMTSDRSYRKALSDEVAISELIKGKDTQFDGVLVDAFISYYNSFDGSIKNHVDEIANQ